MIMDDNLNGEVEKDIGEGKHKVHSCGVLTCETLYSKTEIMFGYSGYN